MTKAPVVHYEQIIKAFRRDGWVVVRQRGSHIRLQKETSSKIFRIVIPAHRPLKRSTLAHILKQADLTVERFIELL